MATIQTLYLGDLRTEITHVQSGNRVITDAPTDNNGKGEYISPTDMVAAALGSCMLTLMGIAARRLEIDLKGTRVEIQKVMAAEPRRIAEIRRFLPAGRLQRQRQENPARRGRNLSRRQIAPSRHPAGGHLALRQCEITGPGRYGGDCQGHLPPRRARRSPNAVCFI